MHANDAIHFKMFEKQATNISFTCYLFSFSSVVLFGSVCSCFCKLFGWRLLSFSRFKWPQNILRMKNASSGQDARLLFFDNAGNVII